MEHLTLETFKEKIFDWEASKEWEFKGEKPCIIDFYADWCGPCKMVAPVLEQLSKEYDGKIDIFKVDTEDQPQLAVLFNVSSIPTILFVPKEGQPQLAMGALPKQSFEQAISDVLKV
jgi:thioredoxin